MILVFKVSKTEDLFHLSDARLKIVLLSINNQIVCQKSILDMSKVFSFFTKTNKSNQYEISHFSFVTDY